MLHHSKAAYAGTSQHYYINTGHRVRVPDSVLAVTACKFWTARRTLYLGGNVAFGPERHVSTEDILQPLVEGGQARVCHEGVDARGVLVTAKIRLSRPR
eukprot:2525291-Rhodomonas_salina.1